MRKSDISSKSSVRSIEEILSNPRIRKTMNAQDWRDMEAILVRRELAKTADHTTKARLDARLEKLAAVPPQPQPSDLCDGSDSCSGSNHDVFCPKWEAA